VAEITLEQVVKVYPDGTEAVRGVDLEIPDGALMVLVGPSGCGKTTILRMVAGLEDITEGEVKIGERIVNDVAPKNRDIAMVFQNYALYPHMSVYDNVAFGLKLRRMPKREIDSRVKDAARILGLDEILRKKPRHLSGGQRQRVAMGRAIVRNPQAFLMDEPLSNLDAKLRVQMRTEISRIQRDMGVTTMYVTHDQVEAMTMGDHVAVMKDGVLQQVDSPQAIYARPTNLFVAGFIGSPPMNLVEATLARDNGAMYATFGSIRLSLDEEVLEARPRLGEYDGRQVVMGIRPEDIEDATFETDSPAERRIEADVELTEAMGSEVFVHFGLDVPPVLTEDTKALAADAGDEVLERIELEASAARSSMVARVNPRTEAVEGGRIELYVDTRTAHFFDRETGDGIY
jgi:multiple sugar transport system ATP-binding protein